MGQDFTVEELGNLGLVYKVIVNITNRLRAEAGALTAQMVLCSLSA